MRVYDVEVYDRDVGDFVQLDPEGVAVELGLGRPPVLLRDDVELHERFRLWEVVSGGTDRILRVEAISGVLALVEPHPSFDLLPRS